MKRRQVLRALGPVSVLGIAGCSSTEGEPSPTSNGETSTTWEPTPATSNPTETPSKTTTEPVGGRPVIDSFTASAEPSAEFLEATVSGSDDEAVREVWISTPVSKHVERPDTPDVTVERRMRGAPGEINQITARIIDSAGNTVTESTEEYVREFDPLEETYADVGAHYFTNAGMGFHFCLNRSNRIPAIGEYGATSPPYTIPSTVTSRHIDRMTGVGISRAMMEYGPRPKFKRHLREYLNSNLADQISFEPVFIMASFDLDLERSWREDLLPEYLSFLDDVLSEERIATYEGRPVFKLWAIPYFNTDGPRSKIQDEWDDGFEGFVEDIRRRYRPNGNEPYVIGDTQAMGAEGFWEWGEMDVLARQFDALTTWTANQRQVTGETIPWEGENGVFEYVRRNFEATEAFATEHGIDFVPMVFPGMDDRQNTCWGTDNHIPRSPEHFRRQFQLADEYRTTEMIDIATWNDWTESAIEPGTWNGEEFGTTYVDIVSEFQRGGPG